uniref:Uncharacterized protein n=1 Tax=Timema tahoe TaxID=61484 RepID=A0A7R9IF34_9NEOP|nr:unnamed protein product [Timema tahoe]
MEEKRGLKTGIAETVSEMVSIPNKEPILKLWRKGVGYDKERVKQDEKEGKDQLVTTKKTCQGVERVSSDSTANLEEGDIKITDVVPHFYPKLEENLQLSRLEEHHNLNLARHSVRKSHEKGNTITFPTPEAQDRIQFHNRQSSTLNQIRRSNGSTDLHSKKQKVAEFFERVCPEPQPVNHRTKKTHSSPAHGRSSHHNVEDQNPRIDLSKVSRSACLFRENARNQPCHLDVPYMGGTISSSSDLDSLISDVSAKKNVSATNLAGTDKKAPKLLSLPRNVTKSTQNNYFSTDEVDSDNVDRITTLQDRLQGEVQSMKHNIFKDYLKQDDVVIDLQLLGQLKLVVVHQLLVDDHHQGFPCFQNLKATARSGVAHYKIGLLNILHDGRLETLYQSLPVLLKVKSDDYMGRDKKAQAYEKLLELYHERYP